MSLTQHAGQWRPLAAPSDAMTHETNMTTAKPIKKLHYLVSCDYHPFRWWSVTAESEIEARIWLADQLGVGLDLMDAKLASLGEEAE